MTQRRKESGRKTPTQPPIMRGILYTQRDAFVDFDAPPPPRQPHVPYDVDRIGLGWTPIAYCTWLTHHPDYPIVTESVGHGEIWFRSFADFVAYSHDYREPQLQLRSIERDLERIRHGQHEPTGSEDTCTTCETRAREASIYDGDEHDVWGCGASFADDVGSGLCPKCSVDLDVIVTLPPRGDA